MMTLLKPFERVLALIGLVVTVVMAACWQATGQVTPCGALAVETQKHIPKVAQDVVELCLGVKGEGGLAGMVLDLGLAVTGQSREKVQSRMQTHLSERANAGLIGEPQSRCMVILVEGLVGRSNGGPRQYALDVAEPMRLECSGKK